MLCDLFSMAFYWYRKRTWHVCLRHARCRCSLQALINTCGGSEALAGGWGNGSGVTMRVAASSAPADEHRNGVRPRPLCHAHPRPSHLPPHCRRDGRAGDRPFRQRGSRLRFGTGVLNGEHECRDSSPSACPGRNHCKPLQHLLWREAAPLLVSNMMELMPVVMTLIAGSGFAGHARLHHARHAAAGGRRGGCGAARHAQLVPHLGRWAP